MGISKFDLTRVVKAAKQFKSITPKPLTIISKGYQSLSISVDTDDYDFDNIKKWVAVLNVGENLIEHKHIALNWARAKKLRNWLDKFLENKK